MRNVYWLQVQITSMIEDLFSISFELKEIKNKVRKQIRDVYIIISL